MVHVSMSIWQLNQYQFMTSINKIVTKLTLTITVNSFIHFCKSSCFFLPFQSPQSSSDYFCNCPTWYLCVFHAASLLSYQKVGHWIFNPSNNVYACSVHQGETGSDKSAAQKWTRRSWKSPHLSLGVEPTLAAVSGYQHSMLTTELELLCLVLCYKEVNRSDSIKSVVIHVYLIDKKYAVAEILIVVHHCDGKITIPVETALSNWL